MPNQNDPAQNPNPTVPPIISPQVDLPPLSPDFQNLPPEGAPPADKNNGSAAPPDISSVIPKDKKKFGGGRIIATILGLIVLIGGVGAGIVLTQQQQLFQQKAALVQCQSDSECPSTQHCSGGSCVANATTTVADGQCLGPGQTCTSGKSYSDNSCAPTDTRCGIKTVTTIADGQCLGPGQTCTSGKSYSDNSCAPTDTRCGVNPVPAYCSTLGAGLICGPVGGPVIAGANYCHQSSGNTYCCPSGQTISGTSCVPSSSSGGGGTTSGWPPNGAQCTYVGGGSGTVGGCAVYTCPQGCGSDGKCGEGDPGVVLTFSNTCNISLLGGKCGQVDTVDTSHKYCMPVGYKDTEINCGGSCITTTTTSTSTSNPVAPSCLAVKAYDNTWNALTVAQLSTQTAGDIINFCVSGNAAVGSFDKAQFMVNTVLKPETMSQRPSSSDYCQPYTILPTDTTINVKAKIHHATSGWIGESI